MLLPKRPLRARTFRLGAGQTIAIGGVARVDVRSLPRMSQTHTLPCNCACVIPHAPKLRLCT